MQDKDDETIGIYVGYEKKKEEVNDKTMGITTMIGMIVIRMVMIYNIRISISGICLKWLVNIGIGLVVIGIGLVVIGIVMICIIRIKNSGIGVIRLVQIGIWMVVIGIRMVKIRVWMMMIGNVMNYINRISKTGIDIIRMGKIGENMDYIKWSNIFCNILNVCDVFNKQFIIVVCRIFIRIINIVVGVDVIDDVVNII